jgi:hypothetical protein
VHPIILLVNGILFDVLVNGIDVAQVSSEKNSTLFTFGLPAILYDVLPDHGSVGSSVHILHVPVPAPGLNEKYLQPVATLHSWTHSSNEIVPHIPAETPSEHRG